MTPAAALVPTPRQNGSMIDPFGRQISYLRVSVTDRCDLRCVYCMSEHMEFLPRRELLTLEELDRLCTAFVERGVKRLRLTGGEPLVRKNVMSLVRSLSRHLDSGALSELTLTTNGSQLARFADELADCGVRRVNVSLDTLDADTLEDILKKDVYRRLQHTVPAVLAKKRVIEVLKEIHSVPEPVAVPTTVEERAPRLLAECFRRGWQLRFIEQMPLDGGHVWQRSEMITGAEILAMLREEFELTEVPGRGAAPAERFLVDGGPATVGVIASVTMPFCGSCDRLRLTADGQLRNCLFANGETDLRGPLRSGATEEEIHALVHECLALKLPGHGINEPGFLQPPRPMGAIGG